MPEVDKKIEWDEETFEAALIRVAAEGVIYARGVRLRSHQLKRLLDAVPRDPRHHDRRLLRGADFYETTFEGPVDFGDMTLERDALFHGATFGGGAHFNDATFSGEAFFIDATFSGGAYFIDAIFSAGAHFNEATFSGRPSFNQADFRGATFGSRVIFHEATFGVDADFTDATFSGGAYFTEATFGEAADFTEATFGVDADFSRATFASGAVFGGTTFIVGADFHRATFGADANFRATFGGRAGFSGATFGGGAGFGDATFEAEADFSRATFGGSVDVHGAAFGRSAGFSGATFKQARQLGPALIFEELAFDGAVFAQSVRIEVSARRASLARVVFRAGADLFVRWAEVSLDDADFAEPSLLAELPALAAAGGEPNVLRWEEPAANGGWVCRLGAPPAGFTLRVVSARRAKVARLTLSGVDLRACRFAGAHGLDGLRLERARFAQPPSGWQPRRRPPRWTRRQTIAEEHHWRAEHGHGHGPGWYRGQERAPDWLEQAPAPPESEQIAAIYRDLRKGEEDSKNEPAAADFYYGEMEMRRHTAKARGRIRRIPRVEEAVLWLYWLVSGYGLRASRALVALAITIALGAILLGLSGFDAGKHPDDGTLLFAAESSISLLRAPDTENLTAVGHVVQIALRLAGPLFFGLVLISLRGRVKR